MWALLDDSLWDDDSLVDDSLDELRLSLEVRWHRFGRDPNFGLRKSKISKGSRKKNKVPPLVARPLRLTPTPSSMGEDFFCGFPKI